PAPHGVCSAHGPQAADWEWGHRKCRTTRGQFALERPESLLVSRQCRGHPLVAGVLQSGTVEHVETYGYITPCFAGSLIGKMGTRPLGDGLLVYFGYPHAHEDDPQRAVRAGLGILAAMGDLNKVLQQAKGIQLGVRLGIHTGLVVVGDMDGEGRYESLALGEVPNICSRIEGLAAPNTIAVSEATYR